MINPKVSVIIPTYNRPELLKRAINSVFNQKYRNFEIVIIDDNSENENENIVKEFPPRYIKYLKRKKREDIAFKRNLGIKFSTGEYVAFLDDDDEWLPNKLMQQTSMLTVADKSVGVIHSNAFIDDGSKVSLTHKAGMFNSIPQNLLEYNFVVNSSSVVKRECFNLVGYLDEKLAYCEDWDFWIRVSQRFRFIYLDEPTVISHWEDPNNDRGSQDLRRVIKGYQRFIAKHWQEYENHKVILARQLFYIGVNLNVLGDKQLAKWYLLKAYTVYPANFFPLLLFCFYTLENSVINKKSDFANILRRFAKKRLLSRAGM